MHIKLGAIDRPVAVIAAVLMAVLFGLVATLLGQVDLQAPPTLVLAEPLPGLTLALSPEPLGMLFALVAAFPEEEQAIDTYLAYMHSIKSGIRLNTVRKVLPAWLERPVAGYQQKETPDYFNQTTREVLESLTSNQKLIAVMTGQWGDNGLPPAQSSFIIHSLIAQHYMYGGYYPVGGASNSPRTISSAPIPIL